MQYDAAGVGARGPGKRVPGGTTPRNRLSIKRIYCGGREWAPGKEVEAEKAGYREKDSKGERPAGNMREQRESRSGAGAGSLSSLLAAT